MKSLVPQLCSSMVGWKRKKEAPSIKQQMQMKCFIYSIKSLYQVFEMGVNGSILQITG